MFSNKPSKEYSQWQVNNMKTEPLRLETEEYWKKTLGKYVKYEEWDSTRPDMIHTYWLKKLTALHERLATQSVLCLEWLRKAYDSMLHSWIH